MKIVTMFIRKEKLSKVRVTRQVFIILFMLYVLLFLTLTLFNRGKFSLFKWNDEIFTNYINTSFNIVPFKTIRAYFRAFFKGNINLHLFLYNIFGNFFALMPFAFGLPIMFKKQNNFFIFFITIIIIVVCIELLQFASLAGSCDIDDFILNVAGSCFMYGFLCIKPIKKSINKLKK